MLRFGPCYIKNRHSRRLLVLLLAEVLSPPWCRGILAHKSVQHYTSSVSAELKEADIFRRPPGVKYPWQQVLLKSLILSVINNKYRGWLWGLNTPYTHKISRQILAPTAWREIWLQFCLNFKDSKCKIGMKYPFTLFHFLHL